MNPQTEFDADFLWLETGEYRVKDVISSEYEFEDYVAHAVEEAHRKFDNVTLVTASREGLGKSLLLQALQQKIAKRHHDAGDPVAWPWDWKRNTVFYDWDHFAPLYQDPSPYLGVGVDEGFEFLLSRNAPAAAQKRMVQDLVLGRFMKKHVLICGGNLLWFDSIVRAHKAHWWIHLVVYEEENLPWVRYAYILRRHFQDWPSRKVQWDALGYLEYPEPVPSWFAVKYDDQKLLALRDFRKKLKEDRRDGGRRRRERGICPGWGVECGKFGPVQTYMDGDVPKKLCAWCYKRAVQMAARIDREIEKLGLS